MKYVRLKDGIIEKSKIKFLADGKVELTDGHGSWQIDNLQIIKESDSIDKLCDLYYIVDKKYPQYNYLSKHVDVSLEDRYEYDIYAMIKTTDEHGTPIIKTVAKWNDRGEWELL